MTTKCVNCAPDARSRRSADRRDTANRWPGMVLRMTALLLALLLVAFAFALVMAALVFVAIVTGWQFLFTVVVLGWLGWETYKGIRHEFKEGTFDPLIDWVRGYER